jgi:hypothetical protein
MDIHSITCKTSMYRSSSKAQLFSRIKFFLIDHVITIVAHEMELIIDAIWMSNFRYRMQLGWLLTLTLFTEPRRFQVLSIIRSTVGGGGIFEV